MNYIQCKHSLDKINVCFHCLNSSIGPYNLPAYIKTPTLYLPGLQYLFSAELPIEVVKCSFPLHPVRKCACSI